MFGWQEFIAFLVVLGAIGYAGMAFYRKSRAFSTKSRCANDCGCSDSSKTSSVE